MNSSKEYDVIVVGAGHAGCEAALAAARMGCSVLVFAVDLDKVASMPCSPSIGGMAKGQLVREIDALGGEMARVTDKTAIHYRLLNTRKGPAVQSSRTQNDKQRYHSEMKRVLESTPGIDIRQSMVERLIAEKGRVLGVEDQAGLLYASKTVILATGTFLAGRIHMGDMNYPAGRAGEFAAVGLAGNLRDLGFRMGRMKTGTPPRLHADTIDFTRLRRQDGDPDPRPFSFSSPGFVLPQVPSYIGEANERTIRIAAENIKHSALYSGRITGVPARYCPSFEDKVVKFPDKTRHQVILEPEGLDTKEIYASGLGNSLPLEIQVELVRSVVGLEEAHIMRPAYAIEYDYVDPIQLEPTLETRRIRGLFLAGQINGTSGYEEAAAQGLWAGINAACAVTGRPPFILDRSQAYMGVLVDDLVTRGTREPYRLFTSRAEYRLLLREDNADIRLSEIGYSLGLVSQDRLKKVRELKKKIASEMARVRKTVVKPCAELSSFLRERGSAPVDTGVFLSQLVKRAELGYDVVRLVSPPPDPIDKRVEQQVEIMLKYEGYIEKQEKEIQRLKEMESILIPEDLDYDSIPSLSNELREKLSAVRPVSLGQASRIPGMTPAGLSVLMIAIRTGGFKKSNKNK